MLFQPIETKTFNREEKKFFSQVAEAVSLAIEKSYQAQKSQELKRQWEATFDAISDPVCLTDSQFNILRVNKGFRNDMQMPSEQEILGRKCYSILFGRQSPCPGCQRGQPFQLKSIREQSNEVYQVYSNVLIDNQGMSYFQMYRDITQSLNLERQVIESAKMAELGTISSSIAHELNNPIGGMLNFLQLMKMDLSGEESYYDDIAEIEAGTQKCRSIVQNLLGFSRRSSENSIEKINLIEVLDQAIKITELKTRSIGIQIEPDFPTNEIFIAGRFNLLAHAFRNILQNSQESIIDKRNQEKNYRGLISVIARESTGQIVIEISDDGLGLEEENLDKIFDPLYTTKDPDTNSGLGLTLAQQIVQEHEGEIKVTINKDKKISLKIIFPQVGSRVITLNKMPSEI